MRLILHLCALPVWQYTLNAAHTSMNQHTVSSLHYSPRTPPHRFLKRTTKCLLNHQMTRCSTYTTPDLPPTLAARLAPCQSIHSKYPPVKSSQPTPNIPLRLLPKHEPYSNTRRFFPHALHYTSLTELTPTSHSMYSAADAKSITVYNTPLRLILHLCAPPVWQYTLNPTQPCMNQPTVPSLH